MKYIRTKDGIIDTNRYLIGSGINKDYLTFYDNLKIRDFELHKDNILEEAETIEKLCDEFVFIDEFFKREHRLAYSLENALARCKYHDVDITTLRGAIWTDKGLIYVAKMNDKGELELL